MLSGSLKVAKILRALPPIFDSLLTLTTHEFAVVISWRQVREAGVVFAGVCSQVLVALEEVPVAARYLLMSLFSTYGNNSTADVHRVNRDDVIRGTDRSFIR